MNKLARIFSVASSVIIISSSLILPASAKSARQVEKEKHADKITKTYDYTQVGNKFETDYFEDTITVDGWRYTLDHIDYTEIDHKDYIVEKSVVLKDVNKNKYIEGSKFEYNGEWFEVKEVRDVSDSLITDRQTNLSFEVRLGAFDSKPEAPKTLDTTYKDVYTGETINVVASLKDITSPTPTWRDDLEIPLVVYGIDCEYYEVKNGTSNDAIRVSSDTPLEDMLKYQKDIVKMSKLNVETNELTSFEWTSGVYEHSSLKDEEGNPVLCRNVIGYGKTNKADYTATYEANNVKLNNCKGYAFTIMYDDLQENQTEYNVKAIATYVPDFDTSIWFFDTPREAIFAGVGLLFIITTIVLIINTLRKNKNKD